MFSQSLRLSNINASGIRVLARDQIASCSLGCSRTQSNILFYHKYSFVTQSLGIASRCPEWIRKIHLKIHPQVEYKIRFIPMRCRVLRGMGLLCSTVLTLLYIGLNFSANCDHERSSFEFVFAVLWPQSTEVPHKEKKAHILTSAQCFAPAVQLILHTRGYVALSTTPKREGYCLMLEFKRGFIPIPWFGTKVIIIGLQKVLLVLK